MIFLPTVPFREMPVSTLHHGRARRAVNGLPAPKTRVACFPCGDPDCPPCLFPRADKQRKETAMNDLDTIMSNYDRHHQALRKLSEGNKGAVFDVLAKAHITHF
jgi:hypothetical protein